MSEIAATNQEESFITYFQEQGLSQPPVPLTLADRLAEIGPGLFATDPTPLAAEIPFLSFGLFVQPDEDDPYLCFGSVGHGIQCWKYRYVLSTPGCGLALETPLGGAYGDRGAESEEVERCHQLAQLCLATTGESWNYLGNQPVRLLLIFDDQGLRFRIMDTQGELLKEGEEMPELLDILAAGLHGEAVAGLAREYWLAV